MIKELHRDTEVFEAHTSAEWKSWLQKYSGVKKEVYLVLYNKDSNHRTISYPEAVEEALCFGWIDSISRKKDAESRYMRFSPRKPSSNWSASNKERVNRLIAESRMMERGLEMIRIAKESGKW